MNDNINNQKDEARPASAPLNGAASDKEEKDFLAREEIKTMEKDISKLREAEAHRERERVTEIKTAEEIAREKEREQLAQKTALESDLAEEEAKEKEAKIAQMREEKEALEKILTQTETEKTEAAAGEFRGILRETQLKEEEARKRFLARVEARAESKEAIPAPLPLIPPIIKDEEAVKTAKASFKKPRSGQKLWIRIILSLLVLSILALTATFLYWYLVVREESEITTPVNPPLGQKELVIPPPLFYIENSQTLKISQISETPFLLSQTMQSKPVLGSLNRIMFEDAANVEILGFKELFDSLGIIPPDNFYSKLAHDATLFIYSQEEGNRLGLVMKITDQEGLADIMTSWEETIEDDFKNLFKLLGEDKPALVAYFKNAQYQGTNFRFQTFSREDLGIVYAIFDNYFILTTSWKSMERALDKLKEAPLSIETMNLDEKIGQLFFIGVNGTALTSEMEKLIAAIRPGGVLLLKKNIVNEEQTKKLIRDLQQVSLENYGIPLFIGVDQEGGEISPVNFIREKTAQSEIKTADQAYAVGLGRGEELKDLGINLNLAPVLDTARPGDFVFSRSFQTTDSKSSALAKALISGQKTASILTAIKHFPGYGAIAFDPEDKLATLDETPSTALFKTASLANPEFVMTSNVIYAEIDPELPFSFSQKGVELLKQGVGQEPLIMTDDLPQQSLIDKFSLKGVVTLPIKAGADILTFSANWETTLQESVRILKEAVQSGEIAQARINDSVSKIIKLKKVYFSL